VSEATDKVVGVAANLLQCRTKFQMESHLEAGGDALIEFRIKGQELVQCAYYSFHPIELLTANTPAVLKISRKAWDNKFVQYVRTIKSQ
jgi:hypothetical protein